MVGFPNGWERPWKTPGRPWTSWWHGCSHCWFAGSLKSDIFLPQKMLFWQIFAKGNLARNNTVTPQTWQRIAHTNRIRFDAFSRRKDANRVLRKCADCTHHFARFDSHFPNVPIFGGGEMKFLGYNVGHWFAYGPWLKNSFPKIIPGTPHFEMEGD